MYVDVYSMYVHVCIVYVQYLWIHSMKVVFWHIEWITSGTHDAPAQFLLLFHTPSVSAASGLA